MIFIIFLVFIYSIGFYCDTTQLGIYNGCEWWNYITYSLIHINFFHLSINSALFLFYWRRLRNFNLYIIIPIMTITPILSAIFATYQEPTVGASAIVLSMVGIITAGIEQRYMPKIILLLAFSFLTTGLFAPHINTLIHVYSFLISFAVSLLFRRFIYDRK